jgi:hypothetical protein
MNRAQKSTSCCRCIIFTRGICNLLF